jgi:predicted RNA-binding protein YlxR (DUF448 family)/ribosomal protein L30E
MQTTVHTEKNVPRETSGERTCVGCGKRSPADTLVRVVLGDKTVVPDAKGGGFGRGAHVHAEKSCLEVACKKGFPRTFKQEVRADVASLATAIAEAHDRRIEGLLIGGLRGGHVIYGTDKVVEGLRAGEAKLVLLAADAAAAAERNDVRLATGEGRALVWHGDRMRLGAALGRRGDAARDGVAICAVTSAQLAAEVRKCWLIAGSSRSAVANTPGLRENAE